MKDAAVALMVSAGFGIGWGHSAYPGFWSDYDGIPFRMMEFPLPEIEGLLAERGIPTMYVIYPEVVGLDEANPWVDILGRARDRLKGRLNRPVLSGYDAFLTNPESAKNMRFSIANRHPSCRAHEILGEWLFREWVALEQDGRG